MIEPGTSKGGVPVQIENAAGTVINPATDGSSIFGNGSVTVTSSGTRVQFPNVPCKKVLIQSSPNNGSLTNGWIIVGGSTVSFSSLNGVALIPTFSTWFDVSNLNQIYIDASDNGAVALYCYEA